MSAYPAAPGDLNWRVSRTCESGACIMVARDGDSVMFGNTQHPGGPVSVYTAAEWHQFLAGVKQGDFDGV
jgi:predicted secreted Zn-dependent protease